MMRRPIAWFLGAGLALLMTGCECREPTVGVDDPLYERFEGIGFDNACGSDDDCLVSGCSSEVCAAETVVTTCEELPDQPSGECGCVENECRWFEDVCPDRPRDPSVPFQSDAPPPIDPASLRTPTRYVRAP